MSVTKEVVTDLSFHLRQAVYVQYATSSLLLQYAMMTLHQTHKTLRLNLSSITSIQHDGKNDRPKEKDYLNEEHPKRRLDKGKVYKRSRQPELP